MTVISILTDFGNKDGFVGTMKGVIWGIAPDSQIADLTHEVAPQNVREGAIALWRAVTFFPPGSVHIAVVDPGVGTYRRPMAARLGGQFYVGPDNGLFTLVIEAARKTGDSGIFIALDNPRYHLSDVSNTFHGRDIFAPVGAHLAAGAILEDMGTLFADPVLLPFTKPVKTSYGYRAHISVVDAFGNLTTDLPASEIAARPVKVTLKGQTIEGLSTSYGHRQVGDLVALVDSENFLEVAVVNGSAARVLSAGVGDEVDVLFTSPD